MTEHAEQPKQSSGAAHSQDDPIVGDPPAGDATPGDHESDEESVVESNPNAAGPQSLEGGMGISSERTGPDGPVRTATTGIEGTGTVGTSTTRAEGSMNSSASNTGSSSESEPDATDERAHSEMPAEGPEMDEGQNDAQDEWRDQRPPAEEKGIDRTVGEDNSADVPSHSSDPKSNPGHSHG